MNEESPNKGSRDYRKRLLIMVVGLAVVYILTFLCGFLQDTDYNFFNYIFFLLLFIGGIHLIRVTVKSEITGLTKGILFLTAISTTLLFIAYIGYEVLRLRGHEDIAGSIEGLLYLATLIFWILVIISLVLLWKIGRHNS